MSKAVPTKVASLIAEDVANAGYELVRVHLSGNGKYAALQIMVERVDGCGIKVEDCARVSSLVSARLEVEPDFAGKYDLEVSSPGIDRPLTRLKDYIRFQGHVAKIDLKAPMDGVRRFQGKIACASEETLVFETDKGLISVPFQEIEQAKLVLTDALMKEALRESKK